MAEPKITRAASPIAALREHATALEAAMELARAKPKKDPVHRLRTGARRIEAQLELLTLLSIDEPRLAGFPSRARKFGKLLKNLRQVAGKVRDLDVQRALVKEAVAEGASKRESKDAKHLRSTLKHRRDREVKALLAELEAHARKLGPRLEDLLDALEPAASIQLPPRRLATLVRDWYTARAASADSTEDGLHTRRKTAKLARYMLEDAHPVLAGQFEELQELGGRWHDALQLQRLIRDLLGKHTALRETCRKREEDALREFRQRLEAFTPQA